MYREAGTSKPIAQELDLNSCSRALCKRFSHLAAERVIPPDVVLEMDMVVRSIDRGNQIREFLSPVCVHFNLVVSSEYRTAVFDKHQHHTTERDRKMRRGRDLACFQLVFLQFDEAREGRIRVLLDPKHLFFAIVLAEENIQNKPYNG